MSNQHARKKERERLVLDCFIRATRMSPQISEGKDDGNEPDFFLKFNKNRIIGIELTQIFQDSGTLSLLKKNERRQEMALLKIADFYYEMEASPPIRVHLKTKLLQDSIRDDKYLKDIAENLAREIADLTPGEVTSMTLCDNIEMQVRSLPSQFAGYRRWSCVPNHIGWSKPNSLEILNEQIRKKIKKVEKYRKRSSEVKLLLYSDRTRSSGMIYDDGTSLKIDAPGFSEVFFLYYPEAEIQRIYP